MSSSRLPGKSLMKIGTHPLIWFVVSRLQAIGLPIVVATSNCPSDDELVKFLKDENIDVYRGSLENVLQRYINTAENYGFTQIVRVTGDNPLVDLKYLKSCLILFQKYTYVDGIYEGGLIKGTGFELVTLEELKKISSTRRDHIEHVTLWLRENINESGTRVQVKHEQLNRFREDIFLTCDYPEDLILLRKIFQNFDYRVDISIQEILQLFEEKPALKDLNRNRHINN